MEKFQRFKVLLIPQIQWIVYCEHLIFHTLWFICPASSTATLSYAVRCVLTDAHKFLFPKSVHYVHFWAFLSQWYFEVLFEFKFLSRWRPWKQRVLVQELRDFSLPHYWLYQVDLFSCFQLLKKNFEVC